MSLPRPISIFALAAVLGGGSLVFFQNQPEPTTAEQTSTPPTKATKTVLAKPRTATAAAPEFPHPVSKDPAGKMQPSRGGGAASPLLTRETSAGGPPSTITAATLAERAVRVEQQANRELERLVPLLKLTPEQQERVFDRLAQNSSDWHPSFQTSGQGSGSLFSSVGSGPATTPTTTLPPVQSVPDLLTTGEPILSEPQTEALINDELERQEWWEEMIQVMKSNMDTGTVPTQDPGPTPLPDKVVEGSDTVVD